METARGKKTYGAVLLAGMAALLWLGSPALGKGLFQERYLYNLSGLSGVLPTSWATLAMDEERDETFVIYHNEVVIFNSQGMEVFRFGDGRDYGGVLCADAGKGGDLLLLSYREGRPVVLRCDYRGEPREEIFLRGLPEELADFAPNRLIYHNEQLYLGSQGGMQIVICKPDGSYVKGFDLYEHLGLDRDERDEMEFNGFRLDRDGNILFTIPFIFKAYIMAPDGKFRAFGSPGGAPGRFNVVAGMVADSHGNYLIADKLKCAVLVFDRNLKFVKEFGYRGPGPENMTIPNDLAIDNQDRIYVSQGAGRGVSVFALTHGDSSAKGGAAGLSQQKGGKDSG